ncbi:LuxR C-terminal-related transcriptional regulator [Pseudooceanicola aestuarii]|uniref:LuxR C-terminal-related transcriptional regulator n=1 Tax=Pseudooceanicola aestuarii TaxID=2697319 RepID=UPI0013D47594|nr:LuxR C-terminal-related transcriptional regulator [Pseudooceanicola aestuarii]
MGTDRHSDLEDRIIGCLYDVAVDPLTYSDFPEHWEELTRRFRRDGARPEDLVAGGVDFIAHFKRVATLLDQARDTAPDRAEEVQLSRFARNAAFAADADLRILAVNPAAAEAFGATPGSNVAGLPLDPDGGDGLAGEIRRLLRPDSGEDSGMLRVRGGADQHLILVQLSVIRPARSAPFAVVVTSELHWPAEAEETLRDAFGLTRAETDILRELTQSRSLRDIAAKRGRSLETVRSQIKTLQSKTECHSQAELLRLVLSVMEIGTGVQPAVIGTPAEAGNVSRGYATLKDRPFLRLDRPGGRIMEYLVLGDPGGRPVVYLCSNFGFCRWPAAAETHALRQGLAVLVPIRPGYGASTPLQRDADVLSEVAGDIAALMDHAGAERAPFLALDDDVIFAARFHRDFPGRITALIAPAGTLPQSLPEQIERMGRWHRFALASARHTPQLLPFMIRAAFAMARRMGKRRFLETIYGPDGSVRVLTQTPEIFEAVAVGSDIVLGPRTEAATAFSTEMLLVHGMDWSAEMQALNGRVPTCFLRGDKDIQTPPATQAEHRAEYPWIDFRVLEGSGQLLFFERWEEILSILQTFTENLSVIPHSGYDRGSGSGP